MTPSRIAAAFRTGGGIDPEFMPHVFKRRQADVGSRRRYGGLGLGLAIVRHLVELHGGTVSAESFGPDRGATFRVRLPIRPLTKPVEPARDDAAAATPHPFSGSRCSMRIGGGGLTIKGELTAAEDLTIGGTFEGSIELPGHRLTVAQGATVNAAVMAESVTLDGRFDGHVTAARVDITPTAVVEASVVSEHLSLKEGAQFTGPVNTERARAAGEVAKHKRSKP